MGGTPSQVGVPHPRLEVPRPKLGGTPSQVQTGGTPSQVGEHLIPGPDGGYPGVPPTMTGLGTPHRDWMGYPPIMTGWGNPPPPTMTGWGTPPHHHHSKHLLRGGRYASGVHSGGLSCYFAVLYFQAIHFLVMW